MVLAAMPYAQRVFQAARSLVPVTSSLVSRGQYGRQGALWL